MSKTLSIFLDESGDVSFGSGRSDYYLTTMVFHNQDKSMAEVVNWLERGLAEKGFSNHCVHTGPLLRREHPYALTDLRVRKNIMWIMREFLRLAPIDYATTLSFDKKILDNKESLLNRIEKEMNDFVTNRLSYFQKFDQILLYYDAGQVELKRIAERVFKSSAINAIVRQIMPDDYRLFQLADFICTLRLVQIKQDKNASSNAEKSIFPRKHFRKQYVPVLDKYSFSADS